MKAVAVPRFGLARLGRAPQIVAFLLVLALLGGMAIEPTRQLLAQRDRISGMAGELRAAQAANARLEAQIARLKNDDYIEQRARAQIGLVRPAETTYVVMPPSDGAAKRKPRVRKLPPPPPSTFFESVLHFIGVG
ncbi:MAG TPA: septum formation initiator family protein [Actinomycetota bacterium]|nr:septum formation initiator family protein [Actinomycetota bacterium]